MKKLHSFEAFATQKTEIATAALQEEQDAARNNEAEIFKSLLSEYSVNAIKELTEEQRTEFFSKLRDLGVNESVTLIEEGTRGQFGYIDKKGNIESAYIHYDSYPENVLPIIKKAFKNVKKVKDVVIKGGSSGLESNVGDMNFYNDGSENNTGKIGSIESYLADASKDSGAEYVYLYDERIGKWMMADIYSGDGLVKAFEALTVSVNEAIKVEYKRDAKKVVTQYNKIFNKILIDLGALSVSGKLGCIKYLCASKC
jgi:hypothetical protein